jgi:hypothetical protein
LLRTTASLVSWISWQLLSAVCIPFTLSEVRTHEHMWEMHYTWHLFLGGLALTHLLMAVAVAWVVFRRGAIRLLQLGCVVAIGHGALFLALELSGIGYSRAILISAAAASFVLTAMSLEVTQVLNRVLLSALLTVSVVMVRVSFAGWPADNLARSTTFAGVKLVKSGIIVPSQVPGGALEVFENGFLVAAGDGGLYYIEGTSTGGGAVRRLPYEIPLNRNAYLADRPDNAYSNDPFRVADILVENLDDRFRLFASHHYWRSKDRCFGIRVSVTELPRAAFLHGTAQVLWRTLYESHPCLPLRDIRFTEGGGRMVKLDDATLLLTVGHYGLDGFYTSTSVPQDPASQYGKTVRIDVQSGAARVYTLGHRNAQGLFKSSDGRLWLTEHGPAGGDELNLLVEGANYGWPVVTYGAAYDSQTWPPNPRDGHHDGYVAPIFAWVPSVAVTSILKIQSNLVPAWQGDLLVASLKGQIIRLRVYGERVVFAEPIYSTSSRIRDMKEAPDGRIVLLQDGGSISFVVPVPARADPNAEPAMSQRTRSR